MKKTVPMESASRLIDERIKELGDWRGKTLAKVRAIIHAADPETLKLGGRRNVTQVYFVRLRAPIIRRCEGAGGADPRCHCLKRANAYNPHTFFGILRYGLDG
jgi:hypothetical protein